MMRFILLIAFASFSVAETLPDLVVPSETQPLATAAVEAGGESDEDITGGKLVTHDWLLLDNSDLLNYKTPFVAFQSIPFPGPGRAPTSSSTMFITGQTLGTLRNNYTGPVGLSFTVGGAGITATDLCRWVVSGNSGTHTLDLWSNTTTVIASTSVNTSGATAEEFLCASITPTALSASTKYYVTSVEANAGDQFHDSDTTVTSTAAATVDNGAFGFPLTETAGPGHSFGPVSFKYN